MNKELKFECNDFFHVEVVEAYIDGKLTLEAKDGPIKNSYLFLNMEYNSHIKRELEEEQLELNIGILFHVTVSEVCSDGRFKLLPSDGPVKGCYLFFDNIECNPHLEKEN